MTIILDDIKTTFGVDTNNLGFDRELLLHINAVRAGLVQLGLVAFELIEIQHDTEWPAFPNGTLDSLVKTYMTQMTKGVFDPIPSQTIATAMANATIMLEGRIAHEIEEVNNAG